MINYGNNLYTVYSAYDLLVLILFVYFYVDVYNVLLQWSIVLCSRDGGLTDMFYQALLLVGLVKDYSSLARPS